MEKALKIINKIKNNSEISYADCKRLLEYYGYNKIRQKGSHAHFRKQNSQSITLPIHNNSIKRIYIKEIIKILNI